MADLLFVETETGQNLEDICDVIIIISAYFTGYEPDPLPREIGFDRKSSDMANLCQISAN